MTDTVASELSPVLTLEEAAELLRLPSETLKDLVSAGDQQGPPGKRVGSQWRFSTTQLLEWIEAGDVNQADHGSGPSSGQHSQQAHTDEPSPVPEIMTHEQAAAFLQITPQTLGRCREKDGIPARAIGKQYRYGRTHIIEWLTAGNGGA